VADETHHHAAAKRMLGETVPEHVGYAEEWTPTRPLTTPVDHEAVETALALRSSPDDTGSRIVSGLR
jgi:hypothetical protein